MKRREIGIEFIRVFAIFMVVMMLLSTSVVFGKISVSDDFDPGSEAKTAIGNGLGVLKWVGYAGAALMLTFAGIKYVLAGADEKAAAKESLMPIMLGAILIFAATTVADFVFGM